MKAWWCWEGREWLVRGEEMVRCGTRRVRRRKGKRGRNEAKSDDTAADQDGRNDSIGAGNGEAVVVGIVVGVENGLHNTLPVLLVQAEQTGVQWRGVSWWPECFFWQVLLQQPLLLTSGSAVSGKNRA